MRFFLVGSLALLLSTVPALAAGKVTNPCDIAATADDVFVGRILNISPSRADNIYAIMGPRQPVRIHFTVTERFAGLGSNTREAEISSVTDYAYLNHPFQIGQAYLIYAHRNENNEFWIDWRSGFAYRLEDAADDLAFLHGLPHRPQTGDLRGFVEDTDSVGEGLLPWAPAWAYSLSQAVLPIHYEHWLLRGTELRLEGGSNGPYYALSNGAGEFQFSNLPTGNYTLHINETNSTSTFEIHSVHIIPGGCRNLYVPVLLAHAVNGRVLGFANEPAGAVKLELVTSWANNIYDNRYGATTNSEGFFDFQSVTPGNYLLGVSLSTPAEVDHPYQRWFYPGVSDPEHATLLHLPSGSETKHADFHLPPRQHVQSITVEIVWPDGKPVQNSRAAIFDLNTRQPVRLIPVDFQEGVFSFTAFDHTSYTLEASDFTPEEGARHVRRTLPPFDTRRTSSFLRIVLTEPGVFNRTQRIIR